MTRVLMSTDAVGGVWDYSLELASALAEEAGAVEVVLAVLGPPPDTDQRAAALAIPGLELVALGGRLEWMEDPWTDVDRHGQELLSLCRGVDLVHLGGFSHGALAFPVPTVVVGHSCVLSWWRSVKGDRAPSAWNEYRRRVRAGLIGASAVVAPSQAMLTSLVETYGWRPGMQVIHNGRRLERWSAPAVKEPLVLSVGRLWDEGKNVARLCAVASRLPWPVVLAGDGSPELAALHPNVRRLGRLRSADLRSAYARASIYALPARYEPFGLSVLEAALSGCALVLGDIPSLRELWSGAARFVPPDDEGALLAALCELMSDERRRQALADLARERGRRYCARAMAARYHTLYDRLLPPARPRPNQEVQPCAS